jgi:uncharacterized protein
MVAELETTVCDGHSLKWLVAAGLFWLKYKEEDINQLNVFPVPDGDTGTNMWMTLKRAYDTVVHLDEPHVGAFSTKFANGALRSGQGNSGVILSQLISGFAESLKDQAVFDVRSLAKAYRHGVEAAYQAVLNPVEGTILTVARESAEALEQTVKTNNNLAEAFNTLLDAAKQSLARTPDLLPILKKAGVVDSGGQGLVFMLEGMHRVMRGEPVQMGHQAEAIAVESPSSTQPFAGADLSADDEDGYGFDVQFSIHGNQLDVAKIRTDIDAMGWSTLVVGNGQLVRVHVHVHNPGDPLSYIVNTYPTETGVWMDNITVENMQAQYETLINQHHHQDFTVGKAVTGIAVVAVVPGDGLRTLFVEDLGAAYIIAGGQTMNPSAEDFVTAIETLPNTEIILLPNNKNVVMAAEQAARLTTDKQVRVVASTTIPQGIGAMLAYVNAQGKVTLSDVVEEMQGAMSQIITGTVTQAVRDSHLNGLAIEQGQYIGLLNGELVVTNDDLPTLMNDLLRRSIENAPDGGLSNEEYEIVTLYYGGSITDTQAQQLRKNLAINFDPLEFEVVYGGQPLYPYIFSVE